MSESKKTPFEQALEHTLGFEGGYADDPDDRGGETFRGISRKNWPSWPGWKLIDRAKAAGISTPSALDRHFSGSGEMEALVREFYRKNFWEPFDGGGAA